MMPPQLAFAEEVTFAAGLLTADGSLTPSATQDQLRDRLREVLTSSLWIPGRPIDDTVTGLLAQPPQWRPPDFELVDRLAQPLAAAWEETIDVVDAQNAVLRVTVDLVEDAQQLSQMTVSDIRLVPSVKTRATAFNWRWPLRLGLTQGGMKSENWLHELRSDEHYGALFGAGFGPSVDLQPSLGTLFSFEIFLLDTTAELPAALRINPYLVPCVMVVGDQPRNQLLQLALDTEAAIAAGIPADGVQWFHRFLDQLAHDRPLDVALAIAVPDALVACPPGLINMTGVGHWAKYFADSSDRADLAELFSAMSFESTAAAYEVVETINREVPAASAGAVLFDPNATRDAAGPAFEEELALDAPLDLDDDGHAYEVQIDAPLDLEDDGHPDEVQIGAVVDEAVREPDDRRLVARVTGPDGTQEAARFVAGRDHQIRLRIAGAAAGGEIGADEPLNPPVPGRSVDLDVIVLVEGSRARPQSLKLRYPATGDGPWSEPFTVRAPRRRASITIFITVLWKGRAIQSATMTGSVLPAGAAPTGPGISLNVDVSSAGARDERQGADATFVEAPEEGNGPVVFDASSGDVISPNVLADGREGLRRDLIGTFLNPPATFADAAAPLASLAARGSMLREALFGTNGQAFADAAWIHVMSFGVGDVPFELIYDHECPDLDTPTTVCARALAGEKSCAVDCPDRLRSDRVCPFGFWGTTKVIERRRHSAGRLDGSASEQRLVRARAGGVVGVAPQANADDPQAGTRIADAVAGFVDKGTSVVVDGWSSLEHALISQRSLLCLVTHTIPGADPGDLDTQLQLGSELRRMVTLNARCINPDKRQPGPIVLALGCDTATIHASFASFVARLHALGAEIVVSAIAQIPGKEVANFIERLMTHFADELSKAGEHRFGAVLTATRRETLCEGDVLALAVTASGDGDVRIGDL